MGEETTTEEALDEAINRMNRKFGARVIGRLDGQAIDCEVISTGSLALDIALGVGGIPRKRITEIYGPPGGGKTSLAQHLVAECQAAGGQAVYIDMEHKVHLPYMAACGVDLNEIVFSQPPSGTAALEIARTVMPYSDLIIIDSAFCLVTPAELESDVGDQHFAILARFLSQEGKKLIPILGMSNCALVFINQIRTGIGPSGRSYEVKPGGNALEFLTSVQIRLRRTGEMAKAKGIEVLARVAKNCVAPPFRECTISIIHGEGIDKAADLLEAAISTGAMERAGSWYKFEGENIADTSGKLPAIKVIRESRDLAESIRKAALEAR